MIITNGDLFLEMEIYGFKIDVMNIKKIVQPYKINAMNFHHNNFKKLRDKNILNGSQDKQMEPIILRQKNMKFGN